MTEDVHSPTNAGPEPEQAQPETSQWSPAPEPPAAEAPPANGGSAATGGADRPEVLVGAAFAGGFVAAMILKRLGR